MFKPIITKFRCYAGIPSYVSMVNVISESTNHSEFMVCCNSQWVMIGDFKTCWKYIKLLVYFYNFEKLDVKEYGLLYTDTSIHRNIRYSFLSARVTVFSRVV